MTLNTFIRTLKTHKCAMMYDGSLAIGESNQLPNTLYQGYLDSLLLFVNELGISELDLEFAKVTARGITVTAAVDIEAAVEICEQTRLNYILQYEPLNEKQTAKTITILAANAPITLTSTCIIA